MKKWTIDPDHSVVSFIIKHMMVADVHGICTGLTGELTYDPADPASLQVVAEIPLNRLTTGVDQRNQHLLSPDFFDAGLFPKVTYRSTRAVVGAQGNVLLHGELTIRDVTLPVIMQVTTAGPVTSDDKDTCIGFHGATRIDREAFGITWNVPIGDTGFMVGKQVDLQVEIEADLVEKP